MQNTERCVVPLRRFYRCESKWQHQPLHERNKTFVTLQNDVRVFCGVSKPENVMALVYERISGDDKLKNKTTKIIIIVIVMAVVLLLLRDTTHHNQFFHNGSVVGPAPDTRNRLYVRCALNWMTKQY